LEKPAVISAYSTPYETRSSLEAWELLEKAYERLLPAIGHLYSSSAGFALSVLVFATLIVSPMRLSTRSEIHAVICGVTRYAKT